MMEPRQISMVDNDKTPPLVESAFQDNAVLLYRFIFSKVGNAAVAQDLTSEVFLKATRWLQDSSAERVRGWLYATARTTIIDYWRLQSDQNTVPLDAWRDVLFCGRNDEKETLRTRGRALQILDLLPTREREVLSLRFLHGYNATEIALALDLTPGNVRVLQFRALRHAATVLLDEEPSEEGGEHRV